MGLDLVVLGRSKLGHEAEWRRLVDGSFNGELSQSDQERLTEIGVPAYESLEVPRVGYDQIADDWIVKEQKSVGPEEISQTLLKYHGYYVPHLVNCDGITEYSYSGVFHSVDASSFRGSLLGACEDVVSPDLIGEAWKSKFPEEAVCYGQALLAAATNSVRTRGRSVFAIFFKKKSTPSSMSFEEQREIVLAAGRWFIFWGERGHPIYAWF